MFLGLLIDLGAGIEALHGELAKLPLSGWTLETRREKRGGIEGSRVLIGAPHEQAHRHWSEIRAMLERSPLDEAVRDLALRIFQRLAQAEARVHFHEVWALDSILDIVGAAAGLKLLGRPRIFSRPLPLFSGTVSCAHGALPLPAPATLELIKGLPLVDSGLRWELVTPTGAAIAAEVAAFGPLPEFIPERIGYGVGSRDIPEQPNLLRGMLGSVAPPNLETDRIAVIETDLDDANPEWLGFAMERLLQAGALDVSCSPLLMKKGRPGTRVTVLAEPHQAPRLGRLLLLESSAIGVRCHETHRWKLGRQLRRLVTPLGEAYVKLIYEGEKLLRVTPEFESCRSLADQSETPLPEVYRLVEREAARNFFEGKP
ncbi:MAG: nickel pincer cofactor biosynthesis protein LarC [Deltaproteobacteria bacterium]|nr:nickel pincer cofactor biosynthesis protein LarC [Deltaproteobacteria bacterium]